MCILEQGRKLCRDWTFSEFWFMIHLQQRPWFFVRTVVLFLPRFCIGGTTSHRPSHAPGLDQATCFCLDPAMDRASPSPPHQPHLRFLFPSTLVCIITSHFQPSLVLATGIFFHFIFSRRNSHEGGLDVQRTSRPSHLRFLRARRTRASAMKTVGIPIKLLHEAEGHEVMVRGT